MRDQAPASCISSESEAMTDDKATPKQWAHVTYWSDKDAPGSQCLLELRARVEALEAAQRNRLREPLHLTPEQEEEIAALLRPNYPSIPTPPPELVDQWVDMLGHRSDHEVFSVAAQWGAEQACRPKPPSLKEQALRAARIELDPTGKNGSLILRALEALPDD